MSDAILLHGKRGAGKSLGAVHFIQRYLSEGRQVATNLDIFPEKLLHASSRAVVYRLPDHPKATDLEALPPGNPNPLDEERNGLLVLDELATFLNSRSWQAGDRAAVISFLAQSRKCGWDLLLIAQGPGMIDKQIRDSLIELQGQFRRMDKVRVPFLGVLWKHITGKPLRFPKVHVVALRYGFDKAAPIFDTMWFFGRALWEGYDTLQKISAEYGNQHLYTVLSPWHTKGRYLGVWAMYKNLVISALLVGAFFGAIGGYGFAHFQGQQVATAPVERISSDVEVAGVIREEDYTQVILTDGKTALASAIKADVTGERYLVAGTWYRKVK